MHSFFHFFTTGVQRSASIGGMRNILKKIADEPINMVPLKIKIKVIGGTDDLINMNHTMFPTYELCDITLCTRVSNFQD